MCSSDLNKCDCEAERAVTAAEGAEYARVHGVGSFLEASAKNNINVDAAFYEAVKRVLENPTLAKKTAVGSRDTGVVLGSGGGPAPPAREATGGKPCC